MYPLVFEIFLMRGIGRGSENYDWYLCQLLVLFYFGYSLTAVHAWHVHIHNYKAGKLIFLQ